MLISDLLVNLVRVRKEGSLTSDILVLSTAKIETLSAKISVVCFVSLFDSATPLMFGKNKARYIPTEHIYLINNTVFRDQLFYVCYWLVGNYE